MCGIAGVISKSGKPLNGSRQIVEAMLHRLSHRGPDGFGIWESDDRMVCFGHRRLAVVDLTTNASQPMTVDECEATITYNGELYDYVDRQASYHEQGVRLRSRSDTEVFLRDFVRLKPLRFLVEADGMFSAAIYDHRSKVVHLMVDRAGEKPLYYFENHAAIYFASELSALSPLLEPDHPLSEDGVFLYFLFRYIPAPFSIYKGIKKVRPGSFLTISKRGEIHEVCYFEFQPNVLITRSKDSFDIALSRIKNELIESIKRRVVCDVPFGVFLSGGVDSSLVSTILVKELGQQVDTFSIGFENATSEHEIARQTAQALGTKHHELVIDQQMFQSALDRSIACMDEPNADRSCPPVLMLSEFARRYVTVALGGDGSDELFGGYPRYSQFEEDCSSISYNGQLGHLTAYLSKALPVFGFHNTVQLFKGIPTAAGQYLEDLAFRFCPPLSPMTAARYLDFSTYLPGAVLSKVDRMAMSVSLEVRTPFLSPELIRTSSFMGNSLLYRGDVGKHPLRVILAQYGFKSLSTLPKRGFGTPPDFLVGDRERFKRSLQEAINRLLNNERLSFLRDGFRGHFRNIKQLNANAAWSLIVLAKWLALRDESESSTRKTHD